jgi:hypothetical protein
MVRKKCRYPCATYSYTMAQGSQPGSNIARIEPIYTIQYRRVAVNKYVSDKIATLVVMLSQELLR